MKKDLFTIGMAASAAVGILIIVGLPIYVTFYSQPKAAEPPILAPAEDAVSKINSFAPVLVGDKEDGVQRKDSLEEGRECRLTGCSGQVCADKEVITTCEYRAEFVCFKNAVCERRSNGQCGWRETDALKACLGRFSDRPVAEVRNIF